MRQKTTLTLARAAAKLSLAKTSPTARSARLVVTILMMMLTASTAWAGPTYNNYWTNYVSNVSFSQIDETNKTITITSELEFALLAKNVMNGENYQDWTITLDRDLDMITYYWNPVGYAYSSPTEFQGTFDGNNKTISHIYYNYENPNFGLFCYIGANGTVKNVILNNSEIICTANTVGTIAAFNYGTIKDCRVESTVSVISGAYGRQNYGGIVGNNRGSISGCASAAIISNNSYGQNKYFGGIAGAQGAGSISNCIYTGTTVVATEHYGAIVGYKSGGTVTNAFIINDIAGNGSNRVDGTTVATTPSDLYYGITIAGTTYYATAAVSGVNDYYLYTGSDISVVPTVKDVVGNNLATENYNVTISPATVHDKGDYTLTVSGNAPYQGSYEKVFHVTDLCANGDGKSEATAYEIATIADMQRLALFANTGQITTGSKYFKLTTDLNFTGETYTAIGNSDHPFNGTFNGQEHTISGVNLTVTNKYMGLFGRNTGTVKNLSLANSTISSNEGDGTYMKGGIAGYTAGIIENCHVAADVTVAGKGQVGGIAGQLNGGEIRGCTSAADVTGGSYQGGLIGIRCSGALTYSLYYGTKSMNCFGDAGGGSGDSNVFKNLYNTILASSTVDEKKAYVVKSDEYITLAFEFNSTPEFTYGTTNPMVCYEQGMVFDGKYFGTETIKKVTLDVTGSRDGYTFYRVHEDNTVASDLDLIVGQTHFEFENQNTGLTQNSKTFTAVWAKNITLANSTSNDAVIGANNNVFASVTLADRTLTKDNNWNTLCLPFSLTSAEIAASPLAGATIKELNNSATGTSLSSDGTLTLAFTAATAIEAGKPYIVKWTTPSDNITDPTFTGVTIANSAEAQANMTVTSNDGKVKFVGQYSPFDITAENINEILYVASGNKIGYSSKARPLKSCRAHFWVQPNGTNAPAATSINLDFGDGETTSLSEELRVKSEEFLTPEGMSVARNATATECYDLQGRKIVHGTSSNGQMSKGLYIVNGRKVVVK